jgi:hypothetical protein
MNTGIKHIRNQGSSKHPGKYLGTNRKAARNTFAGLATTERALKQRNARSSLIWIIRLDITANDTHLFQ